MPKCKACKKAFTPFNSMQKACSPECALKLVELQKKEKKKLFSSESVKKARKQLKKLSDSDRSVWLRKAQAACNSYIRARDKGKPCISCDKPDNGNHQRHASHFRGVGACSSLRFNEKNIYASCQQCNTTKSGNLLEYRIRLVEKVGAAEVEWLENHNEVTKYTIEELKEIEQEYKRKLKELN